MIAIDTNVLIDLLVASMPDHLNAHNWLEATKKELCTTPTNIGEVLRLITHKKVFPSPLTISQATTLLKDFFEVYSISILEESIKWWHSLPGVESDFENNNYPLCGNAIFDARIAVCLKEHSIKYVCTKDSDFKKFSFLKIVKY